MHQLQQLGENFSSSLLGVFSAIAGFAIGREKKKGCWVALSADRDL